MLINRMNPLTLATIALLVGGLVACGDKKKTDEDADTDPVEDTEDAVEDVVDVIEDEVEDLVEEEPGCTAPPECLNAPDDHERFGQPCESDAECGSGNTCILERVHWAYGEEYIAWKDGTCTNMAPEGESCDPDADDCPVGTKCIYLGRSGSDRMYGCIDACKFVDTSWNPYDWNCGCREGYYCSPSSEACFSGCSNDHECCEVWNDMDGDLERDPAEVYFDDTCENYCDGDDPEEYLDDECRALWDCVNLGDTTADYHSTCLFNSDCPPDSYCRNEYHWTDDDGDPRYPDGICVKVRCELTGRGCEGSGGTDLGAECVNLNTESDPLYYCWATCTTGYGPEDGDDNPCRHPSGGHPYTCTPLSDFRWLDSSTTNDGYCYPAMVPRASTPLGLYETCPNDGECGSPKGLGMCYIRMDLPGYCTARCNTNLAQTHDICGAVTTSGDTAPGVCLFGYCRPSCDNPHGDLGANGCPRDDLACYPADIYSETPTFDSDGIAPTGVCFPACSTDTHCNEFWSSPPYTCNTTDGTCFD